MASVDTTDGWFAGLLPHPKTQNNGPLQENATDIGTDEL